METTWHDLFSMQAHLYCYCTVTMYGFSLRLYVLVLVAAVYCMLAHPFEHFHLHCLARAHCACAGPLAGSAGQERAREELLPRAAAVRPVLQQGVQALLARRRDVDGAPVLDHHLARGGQLRAAR